MRLYIDVRASCILVGRCGIVQDAGDLVIGQHSAFVQGNQKCFAN